MLAVTTASDNASVLGTITTFTSLASENASQAKVWGS